MAVTNDELSIRLDECEKEIKMIRATLSEHDDKHREHEIGYAMLLKAFANGDTDGHRRYHELIIAETEERRKLRVAIQEKTISGLIWAALVGAGAILWHSILNFLGK